MSIAIHWRRPWPGRPDLDAGSDQRTIARDFADKVQERAGLASHKEAERLARVTLQCLLARLSRPLQQRILHELPRGLGAYLNQHPVSGMRFEPPERYFEQIARAAEFEPGEARRLAMAVGTILAEFVPEAVLIEIASEVPRVFQALFPERTGLAHLPPVSRLCSDAEIALYMAPTTTPSYLGLAWHSSSQKL